VPFRLYPWPNPLVRRSCMANSNQREARPWLLPYLRGNNLPRLCVQPCLQQRAPKGSWLPTGRFVADAPQPISHPRPPMNKSHWGAWPRIVQRGGNLTNGFCSSAARDVKLFVGLRRRSGQSVARTPWEPAAANKVAHRGEADGMNHQWSVIRVGPP